jgi:ribosomal protein S18 acetylase RimI-like enzyme
MNLQIRNYKKADYAAIKQLLENNNMFDPIWDSEINYASLIKKNPKAIQVATIDNKVTGNIIINFHGSQVAFLFRLCVKKEFRNQGIGSKLLFRAEEIARACNTKEITFSVNTQKEHLPKFYGKRGYKTSGRHYIWMWKAL